MKNATQTPANLLAFDLGAESGRAMLGQFDGTRLRLEEIYRFANGPVRVADSLYTDALYLWTQIQTGLQKAAAQYGQQIASVGVDSWGVDYALLDENDRLLSNPYHYRDSRTEGILQKAFAQVSREEIYLQTGNQIIPFNTLFQLLSARLQEPQNLHNARSLLMLPDLFHFWLCGEKANEYSNATTTQCFDQNRQVWATDLLNRLEIPPDIFQVVVQPGQKLANIHPWLAESSGCDRIPVILPASHDTGSAVTAVPASSPNFMYISSGTWSLVGVELEKPLITRESLMRNLTNEGNPQGRTRYLKIAAGMWILHQCKLTWNSSGKQYSYADLTSMAVAAPRRGILINLNDPEFVAPGDMPSRIRQYCQRTGQPVPHNDAEVTYCILESLAYMYRTLLDDLESVLGKKLEVIHIIGGGSRNALLNQLTADVTGLPVLAGPVEATATGNVLMQAVGLGYLSSVDEIRQVVRDSFETELFTPHCRDNIEDRYQEYRVICAAV